MRCSTSPAKALTPPHRILASGVMARTDIGLLATLFYITYGLSKFFSGIVSDRSNARYFMGFGLIATGVVNICLVFHLAVGLCAAVGAERLFPGLGRAGLCPLLTTWFAQRARRLVGNLEHRA
jgi:OPA family sugar phosphate sensor protein UhpC-like MFS transporter